MSSFTRKQNSVRYQRMNTRPSFEKEARDYSLWVDWGERNRWTIQGSLTLSWIHARMNQSLCYEWTVTIDIWHGSIFLESPAQQSIQVLQGVYTDNACKQDFFKRRTFLCKPTDKVSSLEEQRRLRMICEWSKAFQYLRRSWRVCFRWKVSDTSVFLGKNIHKYIIL